MSLKSKPRSIPQRVIILFIVGCIVFSYMYMLSRYTKFGFSTDESVEIKDQYYMPSYWGSHECSRSSAPCKDIPEYFKGMIFENLMSFRLKFLTKILCLWLDQILTNFWKLEKENHTWHVSIKSAPPCPKDYLIRFVKSSPFNFELRNLVRSHIRNQRSKFNRTLFLIGTLPGVDSRKNQLTEEIKRFNDFIIGDFIDAYRNVTRKSYTAYR